MASLWISIDRFKILASTPPPPQNMVSNTKLFVLGFLCATAIVLGSGIVTVTLVLHKRKE